MSRKDEATCAIKYFRGMKLKNRKEILNLVMLNKSKAKKRYLAYRSVVDCLILENTVISIMIKKILVIVQ
jgi:hypothetical protein